MPNLPPATVPTTRAEIWAALEALLPELAERADEVREHGGLPADLLEKVRAAGAFRIAFPAALGGPEMGLGEQIRYIQRISEVSPSVGWLEMILADSGYFASMLPEPVAKEIFPSLDLGAAAGRGPGRAVLTEGGVVVSGRCPFVSGVKDADRLQVRFPLFDAAGEPVLRPDGTQVSCGAFVGLDQVTIHDTWDDVEGMKGSGSVAVSIEDVLVPDSHWVDMRVDGEVDAPHPLGRYPMLMFLNGLGVLLGTTKAILDTATDLLVRKKAPTGEPVLSLQVVGRDHMHALGLHQAADAMVYHLCEEIDAILFGEAGGVIGWELQGRAANMLVIAAELCRRAADEVLTMLGSDWVFSTHPIAKLYADLRVGGAHIVHRRDYLDRSALLHARARAEG